MGPYKRRARSLAGALLTTVAVGGCSTVPAVDAPPDLQPPSARVTTRILPQPDGTCLVSYAEDCPTPSTCAPATEQVPCPDFMPKDPKLRYALVISQRHPGDCYHYVEMRCPEDATCNPPPPQPVACPAKWAAPEPAPNPDSQPEPQPIPELITAPKPASTIPEVAPQPVPAVVPGLPDGWTLRVGTKGCLAVPPPVKCPPEMACNPPPPKSIPCPPK